MDLGFFYDIQKQDDGRVRVVLYYKEDEFNSLAGLHCTDGFDDDEVEKRVRLVVDQSIKRIPNFVPPEQPEKTLEILFEFYSEKDKLPPVIGRRISVP